MGNVLQKANCVAGLRTFQVIREPDRTARSASELPSGFVYQREFISAVEEQALIGAIERIPFAEIKMHGVVAKRRVAHFGHGYEYGSRQLEPAPEIPESLLFLRHAWPSSRSAQKVQ